MRDYPLTIRSLILALIVGSVTWLIVESLLVGFSVAVLIALVGATWRRDTSPVFPFILAYQWIAVTIGYFYSLSAGFFPSTYAPGDVERTMWLSLTGLLLLALGIRVADLASAPDTDDDEAEMQMLNLTGLFWLVMGLYGINYVYVVNTQAYANVSVILGRMLDCRQILLLALWFEVIRRRTHLHYLWITLGWVFVPLLGSYYSDFKVPLFLLLLVYASAWKPWERGWWRVSPAHVLRIGAVAACLIFLTLVWQAGTKDDTRRAYDKSTVSSNPIDRVTMFASSAVNNLPVVFTDIDVIVEGLVTRLSYVTFFSRTLDYVPRIHGHTQGELLKTALVNAFVPRFLYPDKPELPSDSYYTQRFTGLRVSDNGTSISIGYMAEFYVDWGVGGMFVMIFLWGCWLGLAHRALRHWVRPRFLLNPVLLTVFLGSYQFEAQFIKAFGAVNIALVVTIAFVFACRTPLMTFLRLAPAEAQDDSCERASSTA